MGDHLTDQKFISEDRVRMHDTDAAGILYFARLFRFVHDALEAFMENAGVSFKDLFRRKDVDFTYVIVHTEGDYFQPLKIGDKLTIHTSVKAIGETSFSLFYEIYKEDKTLAASANTIHVTLDKKTKQKKAVPIMLKKKMENYVSSTREGSHEDI